MVRSMLFAALLIATPASDAQVAFTPEPRWREEPDSAELCRIARTECAGSLHQGSLRGEVEYEELYDGRGRLTGVRLARGSGCAPLDEKVLLGQRDFRLAFRDDADDEPDLEQIRLEVAGGTDPSSVRIVRRGSVSLDIGCGAPAGSVRLSALPAEPALPDGENPFADDPLPH